MGGVKLIRDPKVYPYPAYPIREIEGDKTNIFVHTRKQGGFRDYF